MPRRHPMITVTGARTAPTVRVGHRAVPVTPDSESEVDSGDKAAEAWASRCAAAALNTASHGEPTVTGL